MFSNASISVTIPRSQVADFSDPFLEYMTRRRYRGLFGAEFKRDAQDGRVKLLEVNARSMADSYMGRACGADDIFSAYLDAIGEDVPLNDTYHAGVHYINEVTSLRTVVNRVRQGRRSQLGDLRRILSNKHLHLFSRDDLLPVVVEFLHTLKGLKELVF